MKHGFLPFLCLLILSLIHLQSFSQDVSGTFRFGNDSLDLGRPIEGILEITHPSKTVVVFPDSSGDFAPWEIASSKHHTTRTTGGISIDRKTYFLRSFEIDSVQTLRLPFRYLIGNDTVLQYSGADTVLFRSRIPEWNDSLKLITVVGLTGINDPPNYLLFLVIGFGLFFLMGLLVFLFIKPVTQWMKTKKIEREWKEISLRLRKAGTLVEKQEAFINEVNFIWKKYLDPGRRFSLSSLSTPELKEALPQLIQLDESDKSALLNIAHTGDMIQFAGMKVGEESLRALPDQLLGLLEKEFKRRKGELPG